MTTRTTNPNVNCLKGWKCPDCGSYGPFEIDVSLLTRMTDEGTNEYYGDVNYNQDAYARCLNCGRHATVEYFQERSEKKGRT